MLKEHGQSFRDLYESLGTEKLLLKISDLMEKKGDTPAQLMPEDFSIREIKEAVDPTAFPLITGQLISKKVMDAYTLHTKVGDMLTTRMPSSLQVDKVTGITEAGEMKKVKPGMPYEHTGDLGEKWVQIEGDKYGKILDITDEVVRFDQTGKILMRAGQIGAGAAAFREKHILYTIQDIAGYRAYYPSGAVADLYSEGHANILSNKLEDHTDLDAAFVLLGAMEDEKENPIVVMPNTILVPTALFTIANTLYKSAVVVGGANAQPNPFAGVFNPVSSPYLQKQSAVKWYLGNFKQQFVWKEIFPMQVLTRKSNDNEAAWERDIKASFKVRYFGECGAIDYRFVARSSGTV